MFPRFVRAIATTAALAAAVSCSHFMHTAAPSEASLYARLGGYDAIAAVVDDLLGRELKDPAVIPFFKGLDAADLKRIRQHLVDQLCAAARGPCFYPGKDMKIAHAEMEITEDVWNAFTGHIGETLAAFRVGERERNDLVAIVSSLKPDIVKKTAP